MDARTLQLLLDADDRHNVEAPDTFDYQHELARVRALQPIVEQAVGQQFELDTNVQDASFFTELVIREQDAQYHPMLGQAFYTIFAVRFSAFGNLFTVWGNSPTNQVNKELISKVISIAQEHGFVYIDAVSLDEPYSGESTTFMEDVRVPTWWGRFFDCL